MQLHCSTSAVYRQDRLIPGGLTPITPEEAEAAIAKQVSVLPAEMRPLELCSGQTLRQDIYPERDNPPFDRVCMDGIAIASAVFERGARAFRIESTQGAGAPAVRLVDPANAIEVMTGAILPGGTDCIIPQEEYDEHGDVVTVKPQVVGRAFRNVQRRGEDSAPDAPMLKAGIRLGPPEIATAASAGLAQVSVTRQPRIIAISTGDELVDPGQPILAHQIRRSNVYAIMASLRDRGYERVANDHIRDDEQALTEALSRHLSERDVLVLSGGVSKGKFDYVPQVLRKLGVEEIFYEVAQRPGKPMYFGLGPSGQAVFGLPGNPVATLICLVRYVVPALIYMSGCGQVPVQHMTLASTVKAPKAASTYLMPVAVRVDERGAPIAVPMPPNGPGDFLALTKTYGFIELPPQPEPFEPGFVARFYRW